MNIVKRMQAPTPKFFRVLRSVGIALATAAATVLTAPVSLPAIVLTIAGYAAVAGGVITAISQSAVVNESETQNEAPMEK
jgi:uncharacterized membrane protein HdeD (DUF308 family)